MGLFFVLIRRNLSFPFATLWAAAMSSQQCSSGLMFAEGLMNLSLLQCQGQADGRCCKYQRTHPRGGSKASESEGAALRVKRHFQICAGGSWLAGSRGAHFCRCLSHARASAKTTETGKAAELLVQYLFENVVALIYFNPSFKQSTYRVYGEDWDQGFSIFCFPVSK